MVEWQIPLMEIGDLRIKLIQGGMGVGISQSGLASAVANEGGAGIIASVALGLNSGYFFDELREHREEINSLDPCLRQDVRDGLYAQSNRKALREEIRKAREKTKGVIGVNIMHALTDYSSLVETAIEENVDMIISGAGIPKDLPKYLRPDSKTKLIPIVSSARLAEMICRAWAGYEHLPDAIVVEGPGAGGHIGFSREQLADETFVRAGLERIIPEIVAAVKPFETATRKIPIIAAGKIYYGGDIRKYRDLGAAGVQMAERFIPTDECDADIKLKEAHINCKKEDIIIIQSPAGMPGRAIINDFLRKVERGEKIPTRCLCHCLKRCKPEEAPYCIAMALMYAQKGNLRDGYAFCGSNAWRNAEFGIVPVKRVFELINQEYISGRTSD